MFEIESERPRVLCASCSVPVVALGILGILGALVALGALVHTCQMEPSMNACRLE